MKKALHIFLASLLVMTSTPSFAADTPVSPAEQAAAEARLQPKVERVIYSLETFEDVTKDLERYADDVAAAGFSIRTMRQIQERIAGAVSLMTEVLTDKKLSKEKKADYLSQLTPLLGMAFQKILRFQKEDTLQDPRANAYAHIPEVRKLSEKIAASEPGSDKYIDLQDELAQLLNGLEAKGTPTRFQQANLLQKFLIGIGYTGKYVAREAIYDFKAVFTARIDSEMKRVWTLWDRANRDTESQAVIRELVRLTQDGLAKLDNEDPNLSKQRNYWLEELEGTIRLRSDRLRSQGTMAAAYFGLAAWGVAAPMVDWMAMLDGGWSENSLWTSGIGYLAFWGVIGATKLASYSGRTVEMMKSARDMFKNPKTVSTQSLEDAKKLGLWDKMLERLPKWKKCETRLEYVPMRKALSSN